MANIVSSPWCGDLSDYDSYYDSNYDYGYDYGGSYHPASHPTPTRKISKKPSGSNHSPSSYIEEISSSTNTLTTKPIKIEATENNINWS
ncbi:hypothetical protein F8M41_007221 [Gigaspora margarita]|uniref:Uncharacterized protein n=1 Tax=Gigaspora margarita TaxID=4874 RepID=A0A8H4A3I8_GIGMA|nr:hypothetical protein F8M41_007221 [Gigaspora margarita]